MVNYNTIVMQMKKFKQSMEMTSDEAWDWYNKLPINEKVNFERSLKRHERKLCPTTIKVMKVITDELTDILGENNILRTKLGIAETQLIRR